MALQGLGAVAQNLVRGGQAPMGLENLSDDQIIGLLGYIDGLGATSEEKVEAKRKVFSATRGRGKNVSVSGSKNKNAYDAFIERIDQLPAAMQADIRAGRIELIDKTYYSRKWVSSASNAKMFDTDILTATGKCNLLNGKMYANTAFVVIGMRVLSATITASGSETVTDNDATLFGASFGVASSNILNGEFEFGVGSKNFVEKSPASIFATSNNNNVNLGYVELSTPKMILPNEDVKFEMYFAGSCPAHTAISVELIGAQTTKK